METWKAEEVRRIWQRVQAGNRNNPDPVGSEQRLPNVGELIAGELYDSRLLLRLSRYFRSETAMLLRKMAQTDKNHAAQIKKFFSERMYIAPEPHHPAPQNEPPIIQLRGCYERKLKRLEIYRSWVFDPRFATIFEELAKKEQAHCRALLKIIQYKQKG